LQVKTNVANLFEMTIFEPIINPILGMPIFARTKGTATANFELIEVPIIQRTPIGFWLAPMEKQTVDNQFGKRLIANAYEVH
jgi:hypothetical protein